ncbi:hypothetical protein NSDW_10980 [Novosphingobium olei]|nr:hypothetical protein NSDW_10980 [Novosphingobium olei]
MAMLLGAWCAPMEAAPRGGSPTGRLSDALAGG